MHKQCIPGTLSPPPPPHQGTRLEEHKIMPHYTIPTRGGGILCSLNCFHVTLITYFTIQLWADIPQCMSCALCVTFYVPATSLGHPGC